MERHLSGTKILKDSRVCVGFSAGGERFGTDVNYQRFLLCGIYLGVAATTVEKQDEVLIPVHMIKALIDFRETLGFIVDKPFEPHTNMLKKAFELVGYEVIFSVTPDYYLVIDGVVKISEKEQVSRRQCLNFKRNGVEYKHFLMRMMLSLAYDF